MDTVSYDDLTPSGLARSPNGSSGGGGGNSIGNLERLLLTHVSGSGLTPISIFSYDSEESEVLLEVSTGILTIPSGTFDELSIHHAFSPDSICRILLSGFRE